MADIFLNEIGLTSI